MYKSLVRPHLEYAVQAWSPHQLGHIRLIEGVQRRFTRMVPELKSLTYEARINRLNLITLEIIIIRGDLIDRGIQNFEWTRKDKSIFTVHKISVHQHQMSHNETGEGTGTHSQGRP